MSELREAAQADSKLRNQHKAFTHWFLGLHETTALAPEDLAWSAWKAALAQPETAEPVAWAVVCAGNAVSTCLTETAANLIAENLREKNRGRDFDWQTTPLYAHPPRDEWRPASEPPEDWRVVVVWRQRGLWDSAIWFPKAGPWENDCGVIRDVTHWRDVQPPTEGE